MRFLTSFILGICLFVAAPVFGADILIVQSVRDASFTEALKGFSSVCRATSRTLVLSDYVDVDVPRLVREEQPSVIVTLGDSAYSAVRKIRHTPVISLMSLSLSMGRSFPPNVTGIGMVASPEQYLKFFAGMGLERVGLLFNSARSGAYLSRARVAADRAGITLVAHEVRDPRETPKQLASLKGRVDAVWLLPDTTALTPATTEAYFYFSMDQWKPVIAFSGVYLSKGAAAAIDIDRYGMGRQGGDIANRLLAGASPSEIPFRETSAFVVKVNHSVMRKLGLKYDRHALSRAE